MSREYVYQVTDEETGISVAWYGGRYLHILLGGKEVDLTSPSEWWASNQPPSIEEAMQHAEETLTEALQR